MAPDSPWPPPGGDVVMAVAHHRQSRSYYCGPASGLMVAADTVEMRDHIHYNGHPRLHTWGHWVVIQGYYNHGARTTFDDPAVPFEKRLYPREWKDAKANFRYNTRKFATRFLHRHGNGVVW
ncbi:MAG: hypothetical protein ACRDQA_17755 [Nocardioidaceae bacterium]